MESEDNYYLSNIEIEEYYESVNNNFKTKKAVAIEVSSNNVSSNNSLDYLPNL